MKTPVLSVDILIMRDDKVLLGLLTEKWWPDDKSTCGFPSREIDFGESFSDAIERDVSEDLPNNLFPPAHT